MSNQTHFASNYIDGQGIWTILNYVKRKESTFDHMHGEILDAWKENHLYGVYEIETKQLMPCFCISSKYDDPRRPNILSVIWVDENSRNQGFAKLMIEEANPDVINAPMEGTDKFWEKMGFGLKRGDTFMKPSIRKEIKNFNLQEE